MAELMLIRKIVGIVGNVISFGLFLSPAPTFAKIWKKKDVGEFSPVPYVATLLNCAIWVFYGLPFVSSHNTLVSTINCIGFVVESAYLLVFFAYSTPKTRLKVVMYLAAEAAFMAVMMGCVLGLVHVHSKRTLVVGVFAVIFGTCMYASPLSIMGTVMRTKSVRYMPLPLSVVLFVNGLCWLAYSLLKFDAFVLIPNGLGALLGLAQLLLYLCYRGSSTTKVDHELKPPEVV